MNMVSSARSLVAKIPTHRETEMDRCLVRYIYSYEGRGMFLPGCAFCSMLASHVAVEGRWRAAGRAATSEQNRPAHWADGHDYQELLLLLNDK